MMLELNSVVHENLPAELSFRVDSGSFAAIVTGRESVNEQLVRLILGLDKPSSGTIHVMGHDVTALSADGFIALRRKIGIVYPGGGLISNLKIWENVTLPLSYHSNLESSEIENRASAALLRVGYEGGLNELPGNLTKHFRKLVSFARVLVSRPQLIIYHATFDGLQGAERERMIKVAEEFHGEEDGRISLLVTANPVSLEGLPIDTTFRFN